MSAPEVSVVVPCYNAERYVLSTLRSLLAQGLGDRLEILVVDDGSRDASVQRIRASGLPVRLLHQANAGVAAARNRGAAEAQGRLLAFCDADDLWLPGKLARQLAVLRRFPDARLASSGWHVWVSDDPEPPSWDAWLPAGPPGMAAEHELTCEDRYPELLEDCVVWTSTVVMDRALFQEMGGFDTTLPVGEDYDLWLRCSRRTSIVMDRASLALYRMHPASITKKPLARNFKGEVVARAIDRWGYTGRSGRTAHRSRVAQGLARSWADHAGATYLSGRVAEARQAALASLRLRPLQGLAWLVLAKTLFARASVTRG